jgi:glutamyl-tRNA reductase
VLIIIDIANPKDVEEGVGELEDVELYDLDSLYEISEENLKRRLAEVGKVEQIIADELEIFKYILNQRRVERLVSLIYQHGNEVMQAEKKRALRYLENGHDQKVVLEGFAHAVLSKTLHTPTKILRSITDVDLIESLILQFERKSHVQSSDGSEALKTPGSPARRGEGREPAELHPLSADYGAENAP